MLKTPAISPAGEFRRVNAFGALDLRIVSAATEGEMAVWETIVAPEAGPPLHVHYAEDETFYVLAGIFSITVGERSIVASPGATMFLPRGIPHTFRNIGAQETAGVLHPKFHCSDESPQARLWKRFRARRPSTSQISQVIRRRSLWRSVAIP